MSTDVLSLLAVFYHRQRQFPEIRQFTDLSVVKLIPSLEKPDQEARDANTFVLDGSQGVILYSKGLKGMSAGLFPGFKGATAIAVLPNGRIGVIRSDGSVDLCSTFTGDSIVHEAGCTPLALKGRRLAASSRDDLLVLTDAGALVNVDSVTGEQEQLLVTASGITEISSGGGTYALVTGSGYGLAAFKNVGGHCFQQWQDWRACQTSFGTSGQLCAEPRRLWQECKKGNPGNHTLRFKLVETATRTGVPIVYPGGETPPIFMNGITRSPTGRYYVVSEQQDSMLILKANLETTAIVTRFSQQPRPFRRVQMVRGVRMAAPSPLVTIWSTQAMETFSEVPYNMADVLRRTPAELLPVYRAIDAIPPDSYTADPGQDLFARPEIKATILDAIGELPLE